VVFALLEETLGMILDNQPFDEMVLKERTIEN
jgi:hypothetical protein